MTGPPLGHGGHSYLPARRRVRVDPWRIAAAPVFQGWRIIRERFFYDGRAEHWDWDWEFTDDRTLYPTEQAARNAIDAQPS